jgi:HEAT repeat protein/cyclophilin family peptidyl-prolyl cis-trans isomerase
VKPLGLLLTLAIAALLSACATAPAPVPVPDAAAYEQKLAWILRLEDQRVLRDPLPPIDPAQAQTTRAQAPSSSPDLTRLLSDRDARIRRRAALAVGRVGLPEGVAPLTALLDDVEHEVRSMAAFALGLIGEADAVGPLVAALDDQSLLVQGSAAEGLGLIGDRAGAGPVGALASRIVNEGGLLQVPGDDLETERGTPAGVFRLAIYALVRMQAYDELASAVLDDAGRPQTVWWPVAYALQRIEDSRAQPALRELLSAPHVYARAFAVKGLGGTRDRTAVPQLLPLLDSPDRLVAIEAARALGRIGDPAAAPALIDLLTRRGLNQYLRIETAAALAAVRGEGSTDILIDLLSDPSPPVRGAALRGLAASDPQGFLFILSGLDPDRHWSVRAELANVLAALPPDTALPRLRAMLDDPDHRVRPSVLAGLMSLETPDAEKIALAHLEHEDPVVRAAAARALAELEATGSIPALTEAYRSARRDLSYVARAALLTAVAELAGASAVPLLNEGLGDSDWAVRSKAATLLHGIDPASDAFSTIRPAPTQWTADRYATPHLVNPQVSTQLYVETSRGTIQIELAVLDAPVTVEQVVTLARKGFFNGLPFHRVVPGFVIQGGDPRGDGEGGPGFTLRDELNERPFVRGTVGMALDWEDTAGSQFFITHSPQPHLDARYTVIGRVISGMDVVDQIEPWDTITRIHVWDGQVFSN